jgi:hypothetical protein
MTKTRKHIIEKLLAGYYLRSWKSVGGVPCYRLYDPEGNPELSVMQSTIDKMDRHIDPKIKIWRVIKPGKIVLNLASIRKLHGRNYLKQAYRKSKQL